MVNRSSNIVDLQVTHTSVELILCTDRMRGVLFLSSVIPIPDLRNIYVTFSICRRKVVVHLILCEEKEVKKLQLTSLACQFRLIMWVQVVWPIYSMLFIYAASIFHFCKSIICHCFFSLSRPVLSWTPTCS